MASSGVHYEVDPGLGKAVFRAGSVNVSKVNAESPLAIFLFDKDYFGQPVGVVYFSYSSGLVEFADLFIDRFLPL